MTEISLANAYNSLMHISEAKLVNMDKIEDLKHLLRQFGYQQFIGIYRLHKHFNLKKDERVLWERCQKYLYGSRVTHEIIGQPLIFAFVEGTWQPTEFQTINENIWKKLQSDQNFEKFKKQFLRIVADETSIYGFGLNPKDTFSTLQRTNEEERTQFVIPYQVEDNENNETITKYFADCECQEFCSCCCRCRHTCRHACKHGSCKSHK